MTEPLADRSTFASRVAHYLGNELTPLRGFADLAFEDLRAAAQGLETFSAVLAAAAPPLAETLAPVLDPIRTAVDEALASIDALQALVAPGARLVREARYIAHETEKGARSGAVTLELPGQEASALEAFLDRVLGELVRTCPCADCPAATFERTLGDVRSAAARLHAARIESLATACAAASVTPRPAEAATDSDEAGAA